MVYENTAIPVEVLGQQYMVRLIPKENDKRFDTLNCDGFCDYSTHELILCNLTLEKDNDAGNVSAAITHILYHEMVHAFMFESGLAADWEHKQYGQEETVVDWIAWQAPKIVRAVQDVSSRFGVKEDN